MGFAQAQTAACNGAFNQKCSVYQNHVVYFCYHRLRPMVTALVGQMVLDLILVTEPNRQDQREGEKTEMNYAAI